MTTASASDSPLAAVRAQLADLPTYQVNTAWVWATLDFLLDQPPPPGLIADVAEEYANTQRLLVQEYPDLQSPSAIEPLSTAEKGSVTDFKLTTPKGIYVLSVQTQDVHAGGSLWSHGRLPELNASQQYQLQEILTGETFPWDPPYHYVGSYLRGETDRFGEAQGNERWGIKPGEKKGDFQFFHVAAVPEPVPDVRWDDLLAPAMPNTSALQTFFRQTGRQKHHLIRDVANGMTADVVSSLHPVTGRAALMVAFTNGNAGVGFMDEMATVPYEVSRLGAVQRKLEQRGVLFKVTSTSPRGKLTPPILDSIRFLREWHSADQGRTRNGKYRDFVDAVRNLPRKLTMELRRQGIPLAEMSHRVYPRVFFRRTAQDQRLYIFRLTLDGYLYLVEMIFPLSYEVRREEDGSITLDSKTAAPLEWTMAVTTNLPALTPLTAQQLYKPEVLELAEQSAVLRQELEAVEVVAHQQYFAAGSHRFLQFFGRDTLIWLRLFEALLTRQAHETALQGVFDRVSPEGRLPSVEELHDQKAYEYLDGFCWACSQLHQPDGAAKVATAAQALHDFASRKIPPTLPKYGVPDVDMMFLPAVADYLRRDDINDKEKARFLRHNDNRNLDVLLKNIEWVAGQARLYAANAWPAGLIGVVREGDFGNWRDVVYGLGYGIYPADVNAELLPTALRSAREVLKFVETAPGFLKKQRQTARQKIDGLKLEELTQVWSGEVKSRFRVSLTPEEIRQRLARYLHGVSPEERAWALGQPVSSAIRLGHFLQSHGPVPPILREGLTYFPVSLDRKGDPVQVVASDAIFELMDEHISPQRLVEVLVPILLPYPLGLWTPAGFVVASPTLSEDESLWRQITRNAYGGCVIYGWQVEYLKRGLVRQMMRADLAADRQLRTVLYSVLEAIHQATPPEQAGHELWTWDVDRQGFRKVFFGDLPGHNDESNPIQLWSTSSAEAFLPGVRALAQAEGIQPLRDGELFDAVAEVSARYPRAGLEESNPTAPNLPRVAFLSLSLPPGGGGVNIVIANLTRQLLYAGYPMTMLGGQVIAMDPDEKKLPPPDNVYTRLGIGLHIIPEMDLQSEVEQLARGGVLATQPAARADFDRRVAHMAEMIEEGIRNAKVVLIHQYMTMPSNPVVTEAVQRLARKYQGLKRFVAWVHNALPGPVSTWPLSSITQLDPRMEYVAVSAEVAEMTTKLFGIGHWPWMADVIKNSISAQNLLAISPKVLEAYFRQELYNADLVLFYPARLVETKEVAGAIAAVGYARANGIDVRLVISTTGYEGQIPLEARGYYEREMVPLMQRLGLTEREVLIYLHEPPPDDLRTQKEIWDWFILTDGLLFPSQQETAGIPIKEAKLAGRAVFHTDLSVLNPETEGYPHVWRFPVRQYGQPVEDYGRVVGEQIVRFSHSQREEVYLAAQRAQKREMAQTLEAFTPVISSWLNVPPPAERSIRAGTRNYPEFRTVEGAMEQAADAGFRAFEINFDGFKPSDIDAEGLEKIRRARGTMRLSLRLVDFPNYPEEEAARVLREAAVFAMEIGAQCISVPVRELDGKKAAMLLEADRWSRQEANRRQAEIPEVLFAVENAWATGTGEWHVLTSERLNQLLANQPIGLSIWVDPFRRHEFGNLADYVSATRLRPLSVHLGWDFFQYGGKELFETTGDLMRRLRSEGWGGDVIGQAMVAFEVRGPVSGALEIARLKEQMKAGLVNQVTAEAYLSKNASLSLHTTGDLYGAPSLVVTPPIAAGLEEAVFSAAEEAWETAGLHFPDVQLMSRRGLVLTEEAVMGVKEPYRPGLGIHLAMLLRRNPGAPMRIVAHDQERAQLLARIYQIPLDQVLWPREGQSYEDVLIKAASQYRADKGEVFIVHTARLNLGIPQIILSSGPEAWLNAVTRLFELIGLSVPSGRIGLNLYYAADLATETFADLMA